MNTSLLLKSTNSEKINRSPLFYVGDKYQIIRKIKGYFPQNIDTFIEPFAGGGTVFLNVNANKYLLNDIDQNIYLLHKFLISQAGSVANFFKNVSNITKKYNLSRSYFEDVVPIELKIKWKKTYYARYNKAGYSKLRLNFNTYDQDNMLKLYILLIYGFNRMLRFNLKGQFNLPVGNVDFNKNAYNALTDYFDCVIDKNIEWHKLDFYNFIKSIEFKEKDFIYLDPPYLITSSEYCKLWGIDHERRLLDLLNDLNRNSVKFAISNVIYYKNKKNKIFMDWMKNYRSIEVDSNYISYHNNSKKRITEVLVTNYD